MRPDDELALGRLLCEYAACVDGRDHDGLRALFTADATLTVYSGERLLEEHSRPDGILAIFEALDGFVTLHEVAGHRFDPGPAAAGKGDEAHGEAVCIAHHVKGAEDLVVYGRYRDRYRRTAEGWRFLARRLDINWTERRAVRLPGRA